MATACVLAALIVAAPAAADSLVFVRDNNIWLSNADGSGQYQVTLDGTASSPYESPSQADDGTIVALRTPPGGRPQIWRMHQNGGLLNPPVNTPAPGTGALDARVSPDGNLVAYWFVTQVATGTCLYCWDLSTRTLISHSDRFTNPDEVGTPNTGEVASWMSNDTLLIAQGNAEQWYYKLGMQEAAQWWADQDNCNCTGQNQSGVADLTEGEVNRAGKQIAVVRGDNREEIWLYATNGAPPAVPSAKCALTGAVGGKFYRPSWSLDGSTLAWQEGDGIWSAPIPDLTAVSPDCSTISSRLVVPGGTQPDFGPAAVNPGPRPGCGNPGNPAACSGPSPTPTPGPTPTPTPTPTSHYDLGQHLATLISNWASAIRRLGARGLLRAHQFTLRFTSGSAGTLTIRFTITGRGRHLLATGRTGYSAAGQRTAVVRLPQRGLQRLRRAHRLRMALTLTFTPVGGAPTTIRKTMSLSN
jgi:hypothetical protein